VTYRSCTWSRGLAAALLLIVLTGTATGCRLFRRGAVTTDRPVATDPETPENPPALPEPEPEPEPVDELPEETPDEPEPEPEVEARVAEKTPPAAPTIPIEEPVPAPKPAQPEPAETLSATLQERELSEEIAAQVDSGRVFLQNAKEARDTGDLKRADVLIDKCLVLLEDAERQTRP
jgi:outer membrane biosynthesis protein TonB